MTRAAQEPTPQDEYAPPPIDGDFYKIADVLCDADRNRRWRVGNGPCREGSARDDSAEVHPHGGHPALGDRRPHLLNIVGGLTPQLWPKAVEQDVIAVHKSVGITILGLVILRILWRATHPPPHLPATYKPWERTLSHIAHGVLYLLILAIPITGYLHDSAWKEAPTHPNRWFGLIPWPRAPFLESLDPATKEYWHDTLFTWHMRLAFALLGLLVLHVAGALKHQFVDREQELQRMMT